MTYFPMHDFGPAMKGMVIGGLGIFHVFLAQFAIGGGMLMCYFQWLAMTRPPEEARHFRTFLDSYFKFLVLVSFVLGALTGVAMWFTSIQVSPRTIGLMIDEFHWVWATEWTFFCLEVVAGYAFYRYGARLPDRTRLALLALYSVGAWFSLFWINGILSWQLTPGGWVESRNVWAGFFNRSFWPSLLFRTVVSMTIAALVACVVVNTIASLDREARRALINRAAHYLASMLLMPVLGAWYLAVIPADSRAWAMGGSPTMTMFMALAVGASVLIGGYAIIGLWRQRLYINGATATLLVALAFGATAGGEFVREGVRKPYTIRQTLYSNSIRPEEVVHLRRVGVTTGDPYPIRDPAAYPTPQVRTGAKVYRNLCSVCHTLDGANGLSHLAGSWSADMQRRNFAQLHWLKTFMPPFAGTPEELEALVQFLQWHQRGRPAIWKDSTSDPAYPQVLREIARMLDEAGHEPIAPPGAVAEVTP